MNRIVLFLICVTQVILSSCGRLSTSTGTNDSKTQINRPTFSPEKASLTNTTVTNTTLMPKTGVWLNPSLNGTGLAVEVNPINGQYLVGSFYFDQAGTPRWSIMGLSKTESSTDAGYVFTLSDYLQTPQGGRAWDLSSPTPNSGISLTRALTTPVDVNFTSPTHGNLGKGWGEWTSNTLNYYVFASGTPSKAVVNGWYIDPANSPWAGYFLVQQGNQVLILIATYDSDHRPIWGLSTLTQSANAGVYANFSGYLSVLTNGNPLGVKKAGSYNTTQVDSRPIQLQFSDSKNAVLILPNGNKLNLQRFELGSAPPAYCSDSYYRDALVCNGAQPSYCSDPYYADAIACNGAKPSYCSDPYYRNKKACVGATPSYCSDPYYRDSSSCIGSNPSYCSDPYYKDAVACNGSNPSYCSDSYYHDAPSCVGSWPAYCSDPYYKDALACNASSPSYCSDPYYGDAAACINSNPSYCSDPYYKDKKACARTNPSYCSDPYYKDANSCIGSNPYYCSESYYGNAAACIGSNPSYCSNAYYKDATACAYSNPSYCSDPYYSNAAACSRSNPSYCSDPYYKDAVSCLGSIPSYCSDPTYNLAGACNRY